MGSRTGQRKRFDYHRGDKEHCEEAVGSACGWQRGCKGLCVTTALREDRQDATVGSSVLVFDTSHEYEIYYEFYYEMLCWCKMVNTKVSTHKSTCGTNRSVLEQGHVLTESDMVLLMQARGADFDAVCYAADQLRAAVHGDTVTYVVNRNINYTNICTYK